MIILKKTSTISILFVFLLFSSCEAYQDVEIINVGDYMIENVTGKTIDLSVNIEVNNPNGYNIRIKKTSLDLFLEQDNVGKADLVKDVVLKKKKQDKYKLVLRTNYSDISNKVLSKLPMLLGKKKLSVGVKGKVKAKAYGIIGKKIDLDVKEDINVSELQKLINPK